MAKLPKYLAGGSLGLLAIGVVIGVGGTLGFDVVMEKTNSTEFCISCHEMEAHPWQESLAKAHAASRVGFTVSCADCHVPKAFIPKMKRKIEASREVWHHVLGTLDTPEKYELHRKEMAEAVWKTMEENDSANCRVCHHAEKIGSTNAINNMHQQALGSGATCITCHKGIAHDLPGQ